MPSLMPNTPFKVISPFPVLRSVDQRAVTCFCHSMRCLNPIFHAGISLCCPKLKEKSTHTTRKRSPYSDLCCPDRRRHQEGLVSLLMFIFLRHLPWHKAKWTNIQQGSVISQVLSSQFHLRHCKPACNLLICSLVIITCLIIINAMKGKYIIEPPAGFCLYFIYLRTICFKFLKEVFSLKCYSLGYITSSCFLSSRNRMIYQFINISVFSCSIINGYLDSKPASTEFSVTDVIWSLWDNIQLLTVCRWFSSNIR